MKERTNYNLFHRVLSLMLAVFVVMGCLPVVAFAADDTGASDRITTIADPGTLTRPDEIYGNDTQNAGKVTVGKSVATSDEEVVLDGYSFQAADNNFTITISQSAQVMGLLSEKNVPVDVVFVLDTSGSMAAEDANGKNRTEYMVEAVNETIAHLMSLNPDNRVGVVAFSAHNQGPNESTDNGATTLLSPLASYAGEAATEHLTWDTVRVGWANGTFPSVRGRTATGGYGAERYGTGGATNVQAGIAAGAQLLVNASLEDDHERMPFLIVLSDGAPTVSSSNNDWWNPHATQNQGDYSLYKDENVVEGNSFLALLTASYYKNLITEHYFGDSGETAKIYTVGLMLDAQGTNEERQMSVMTLDPTAALAAGSTNLYKDAITAAWNDYASNTPFRVLVGPPSGFNSRTNDHDGYYHFYAETTRLSNANDIKDNETWQRVGATTVNDNIDSSVTTLAYNDAYHSVTDMSELTSTFSALVSEIYKQSISSPTHVDDNRGEDFSGYVTFTDVIGEYMEVVDMKGIVADGHFYQGASFARLLQTYGKSNTAEQVAFDAALRDVLGTRVVLGASADVDLDEYLAMVVASENQGNWTSNNDFDNSMCWWGKAVPSDNGDQTVQMLGFADDDSVDYIANTTAPDGANVVCRSYYFYGTAGNTVEDPNHEYLYFVIRVQRSLEAPYQQTVVISAPASLLSMERVLIREMTDEDGNVTYTASVDEMEPVRVVYEIGLRSDIHAGNVQSVISNGYKNEVVNGEGSVNYDPATDTYYFFTNDWDRSQSVDSHERPLTKATFNAAADNAFYTYQQNTRIVDASGNPVTTDPAGMTAYYVREYYEWSGEKQDGVYAAEKKTTLVEVDIPADAQLIEDGGNWYIPAGTYTAATLVVNGDDTAKTQNLTGTSEIVAHPHRTGEASDSHYTVFLGNNGKLGIVAEDAKTVDIGKADGTAILDADGEVVMVGDTMTYHITARNTQEKEATIVITDKVPNGTEFVSAEDGGTLKDGVVIWTMENVAAGAEVTVSFTVRVTRAALDLGVVTIDNTASVKLGNDPSYDTNTTSNPPEGKKATNTENVAITGEVQVGDILVYNIQYVNNEEVPTDILITDIIPDGTAYIDGTATHGGVYARGTLSWTLRDVAAGASGVVTFRVAVTADAIAENDAIRNSATITVGTNDPRITNETEETRGKGDLTLEKIVDDNGLTPNAGTVFTIELEESTGTLNGTFAVEGGTASNVTFVDGRATVSLQGGDSVTVKGLPAGSVLYVWETAINGYSPSYEVTGSADTAHIPALLSTAVAAVVPLNSAVCVVITNDYALTPAVFQIKGSKTFTGVGFPEGTFTFRAQLFDYANNRIVGGTDAISVTATATYDGTDSTTEFVFSPRTFSQDDLGTRYYLLTEDPSTLIGVTTDATQYLLKVEITDDGEGAVAVAAQLASREGDSGSFTAFADYDWANDALDFENTYVPHETSLTLGGEKLLSGRYLENGEFGFELIENGVGIATATVVADGTDYDGTYQFAPITYTKAGTHVYTIREVPGGLANVTYDATYYIVTVTVTDVNGVLSASTEVVKHIGGAATGESGSAEALDFRNVYTPDYSVSGTSFKPEATKSLVGRDLVAGEFSFEVIPADDAERHAVSVGTNDATGTVVFTEIGYTAPGTYRYEIIEAAGVDPTVTYDDTVYHLTVVVADDGNGNLIIESATCTDANGDGADALFTNHYGPGSTSIILEVEKTFATLASDKIYDYNMQGSEFDFNVYENVDGAKGERVTGGTNGVGVDGVAPVIFGSIVYTREDVYGAGQVSTQPVSKTFAYIIEEEIPANADERGILIDTSWIYVTVTVTDDGYGNMTATAQYTDISGDADNRFVNIYDPTPAEVEVTVDKLLENKQLTASDAFTFVLDDGTELLTAVNDATGKATFTLTYEPADMSGASRAEGYFYKVFTYELYESDAMPDNANGTYRNDTSRYTVTVTVSDYGNGRLEAVAVLEKDGEKVTHAQFRNSYVPDLLTTDLSAQIGATKTVENAKGETLSDLVAGFVFELIDVRGTVISEGVSGADGIITFDALTFDKAGEYHYRIREVNGGATGYTYDSREWEVQIAVSYDREAGALYIPADGVTCTPVNDAVAQAPDFTNIYQPVPTSVTITAQKLLEGRDLREGEFTFHLMRDGLLYAEAHNAADGTVTFAVTLDEAGEYDFVIHEHKPGQPHGGVTYDENSYAVDRIVVVDDNGTLKATVNDEPVDNTVVNSGAVLVNTYVPEKVTVELTAQKLLEGRELTNEEFTFRVTDENGTVVSLGTNDAEGNVTFEPITYTAEDMAGERTKTFAYTVSEVAGDDVGMNYDETVYTIAVTVTDDQNGKLQAVVASPSTLVFHNRYAPLKTTLVLEATKVLTGRDLAAGEFSFAVLDVNGEEVASGTNTADGTITFTPITFDIVEVATFTMVEIAGEDTEVRYDDTVFAVTVVVADVNGQLVATPDYGESTVVFNNTYITTTTTEPPTTTTTDGGDVPTTTYPGGGTTPTQPVPPTTTTTTAPPTTTTTTTPSTPDSPQTGDTLPMGAVTAMAAAAISIIIPVMIRRKKQA